MRTDKFGPKEKLSMPSLVYYCIYWQGKAWIKIVLNILKSTVHKEGLDGLNTLVFDMQVLCWKI